VRDFNLLQRDISKDSREVRLCSGKVSRSVIEYSFIDFNFERGMDEEEAIVVDVGLCSATIFIIIVC